MVNKWYQPDSLISNILYIATLYKSHRFIHCLTGKQESTQEQIRTSCVPQPQTREEDKKMLVKKIFATVLLTNLAPDSRT